MQVDESRFDEDLAREWQRFPPPPEPEQEDVELERALFTEHFRRVRERPGLEQRRLGVCIEDLTVPSLIDEHQIPVRVYKPSSPQNGRGLLYVHGGAFVIGDPELEEEKCIDLARGAGCLIASVDYRLAPEHPYPTPLEDCWSALLWFAEQAPRLGVDPARIGVGGCSAGGALAASVAQLSRDRGGPALALQLLLYPVLDASLSAPSVRELLDDEELEGAVRMWEHYLGGPLSAAPSSASPAARTDLTGLAPACVLAGELDFLRDEAIAYAQRLLSAGVSVELQVWPRTPHAVELFAPDALVSRQSVQQQADALVRFLG
jgi:acetyl esterase